VPDANRGPFPLEEIQNATAGYYGLINHVDDQVARALAAFYSYGGPRGKEPLWIIFTSDHGEMLGDHHLFRKSLAYEGSTHVPFFITGRNVDIQPGTADCLVGLEDLLPTFCDLAGAQVPDGVDGRSLMPIVRGQAATVREELHGEHSGGAMANHFLIRAQYKYIWYARTNEEQVFDLQADPHERCDLSADENILRPLRQRMAEHLHGRTDYTYDLSMLKPLANATPKALW
jgi:arylsulfatase A-like enzyme